MCISILWPSLSPSTSLAILFIHSAFSLCCFGCHIFTQNVRSLWRPVFGMFLCHAQLLIEFSFVVLKCPVLFLLFYHFSTSLKSPFFPQNFLGYFLKLYCFFNSCCLFHFFPTYSRIFLFYHFSLFSLIFLSACPVEFPILMLTVSSCLWRGSQFSHSLISPLHWLDRLTLLYYSLICKASFYLSCSLLFYVFFILCFLIMVV